MVGAKITIIKSMNKNWKDLVGYIIYETKNCYHILVEGSRDINITRNKITNSNASSTSNTNTSINNISSEGLQIG
jgi:RNase P/RNase MRP subunit p29